MPSQRNGKHPTVALLRDAAVLQLKLVMDGLRDLLLVPTSLVAAVLSLVTSRDGRPGPQFHDVLALGKRSEQWIDLFGALPPDHDGGAGPDDGSLDDVVQRMEAFVVEEYRRGGVTKQAKERIDRAFAALNRKR